ERQLVRDAAVVALLPVAVRKVRVGHHELPPARDLHPPLAVERMLTKRRRQLVRRRRGVQTDTAVARLRRRDHVAPQAARTALLRRELRPARAHLLQRHYRSLAPRQPAQESPLRARADAIDVPGPDLQAPVLPCFCRRSPQRPARTGARTPADAKD